MATIETESSGRGDRGGSRFLSGLRRLGTRFFHTVQRFTQPEKAAVRVKAMADRAEDEAQELIADVEGLAQKDKPSILDFDRNDLDDPDFSTKKLAALGSQRHLNDPRLGRLLHRSPLKRLDSLHLGDTPSFAQEVQNALKAHGLPDLLHSDEASGGEQRPNRSSAALLRSLGRTPVSDKSGADSRSLDTMGRPNQLRGDPVYGEERPPSLNRAASFSGSARTVVSDKSSADSGSLYVNKHPNPLRGHPVYGGEQSRATSRPSSFKGPTPSLVSDKSSIIDSKPQTASSSKSSVHRLPRRDEILARGPIFHNGEFFAESVKMTEVSAEPKVADSSRAFVGRNDHGPDCGR